MALVVPDIESITNGTNGYDFQSVGDYTDDYALAALGHGYGVITGCNVVQMATPAYSASVNAGVAMVAGSMVTLAGGSVTIVAASSTDRRDIVYVNSSGTLTAASGTPCGTAGWVRTTTTGLPPVKPSVPAGCTILGEVGVPGGAASVSTITNTNIVDKTTPVGGAPGTLLARTQYAPSAATTYTPVALSTGLTALDTTNLKATFIAPPSGAVMVTLSALASGSTTAGNALYWGLVSTTSSPGTLVGVNALVYVNPTTTAGDNVGMQTMTQLVTGLTAGTSYTWYFAAATTTTGHVHIIAQGGAAVTTAATGAPAFIEIYAA